MLKHRTEGFHSAAAPIAMLFLTSSDLCGPTRTAGEPDIRSCAGQQIRQTSWAACSGCVTTAMLAAGAATSGTRTFEQYPSPTFAVSTDHTAAGYKLITVISPTAGFVRVLVTGGVKFSPHNNMGTEQVLLQLTIDGSENPIVDAVGRTVVTANGPEPTESQERPFAVLNELPVTSGGVHPVYLNAQFGGVATTNADIDFLVTSLLSYPTQLSSM